MKKTEPKTYRKTIRVKNILFANILIIIAGVTMSSVYKTVYLTQNVLLPIKHFVDYFTESWGGGGGRLLLIQFVCEGGA
jgi:hypothetical protein